MKIENIDFEDALINFQPLLRREGFNTVPDTTFEQVGALNYHKKELEKLVLLPLKHPE